MSAAFRTVTILSDRGGRVAEVYVTNNGAVKAGDAIFRLDTTRQRAAVETAQRRIEEIEAALGLTATEVAGAAARLDAAEAGFAQATSDLERRLEQHLKSSVPPLFSGGADQVDHHVRSQVSHMIKHG